MKGQTIAEVESNVRRIDQNEYRVKSQSGNGEYQVLSTELGWTCACPDFIHREQKCKHIFAVELSLELRRRIENAKRIVPLDYQSCLSCGSEDVIKHGVRKNKNAQIQRYSCNSCGKWFVRNLGFERMGASPQAITSAMQLYFSGESLRSVQKFLRLQGVNVSHVSVYNWIQKYVGLMGKYLDQVTPQVSDTWRADEVYLKVRGNMKYLFAMMDDESRFWIAQEVADTKDRHDARGLFAKSKELMGKRPQTIITDGMEAYHQAWLKEFRNLYNPNEVKTVHIRHISIKGDRNNNKMERLNGEFRDREKVMRGLKRTDSIAIKGYQLYHNFIRPHEALGGKTPADKCGISIEGENKWLTIIQNAVHEPKVNTEETSR
jgi:putative transposase